VLDHLRKERHPGVTRFHAGPLSHRLRHPGRQQRAARSRRRDQRSVPRLRRCVIGHGRALPVWTGPGQRSGCRASHLPVVRFVPRSGRQRLAVPGNCHAAAGSHRPCDDDLRVGKRSGERVPARGGRPRTARKAHRAARRELARLVGGVHGGGAGWRRAAAMNDYEVNRKRQSPDKSGIRPSG
jgi:hypothetical protein